MDIRNINLSFFSSVFKCSWHFLVISEYCKQKLRIHNQENTKKIVGAPEFWCLGTRTLVPFQVDNRFFVLISKMGFRNINLSFFPSVFMCSWHFLVLSEYCQQKWGYTTKKTLKKLWGHQSSGARAPELCCPLCFWLLVWMVTFVYTIIRVGKCQIFYTDNINKPDFTPRKACKSLYFWRFQTDLLGFLVMNKCG